MQSQLIGTKPNMIQIDRHIEILLLDNDCVIVPELGGFMAHHVCARYCADTQSYLPPLRQLGFNAQLKINDSLLAQSYIEAYDISYPEAIRRIEEEVSELKQMLQNDGYCELNDIGVLRLNIEGNIEFEPCESGILTPELYGLNIVDVLPVKDSVQPQSRNSANSHKTNNDSLAGLFEESPKASPELDVNADLPKQEADNSNEESSDIDSPATISIKVSTIKYIGTVAAVILALFVCALPFGKMSQPQISKSQIDTGVLYKMLPSETGKHKAAKDVRTLNFKETKPANNTIEPRDSVKTQETVESKVVKKEVSSTDKPFYGIVLASRVSRVNAQAFVYRLQKAGFSEGAVVGRPNGSIKVVYGHYSSENEARKNLNQLRDSSGQFADGWVMEFD